MTRCVPVMVAILLSGCQPSAVGSDAAPGLLAAKASTSSTPTSQSDSGTLSGESVSWPQVVKTKEQVLSLGTFHPGPEWKHLLYRGMELSVAVETWPSDNESYIDVYAYIHNRHFQDWRRFVAVQIRGAGLIEVRLDEAAGTLTAVGAANNDRNGKALFVYDLRGVYDDH